MAYEEGEDAQLSWHEEEREYKVANEADGICVGDMDGPVMDYEVLEDVAYAYVLDVPRKPAVGVCILIKDIQVLH